MLNSDSLQKIFKATPFPTAVLFPDAPDFTVADANVAFLKKVQGEEQEIIGKSIFDIFPYQIDSCISDLKRSLETVISTKRADKMPVQKIEIADEGNNQIRKYYYQFENIPLLSGDNEIEYIVNTCSDVTEKEIAARQLKSTEEKLSTAQRIAKIGYWKFDIKKNKLFCSEEVYVILGVNKEDFKARYKSFYAIVHPEDKEAFAKERSAGISGEKEVDFEFRVIQPDGIQKWIHEKAKLVKNETGEPISFEGTLQDITAQKLLKLSLEETNRRYYYATKATFDAIYDWDLLTDSCHWGEGFIRDFGYNSEMLSDKKFWNKHVHPEDRERINQEIKKAVSSMATNFLNEYRFKKTDGSYAYVLDRSIILRDKNGKAIRMIGVMQDITEKKTLQQLLDKANRLARIGSWEIDVETATVYWSDLVKEIRETPKDFKPTLQEGISRFKPGYSKDTIIARVKEAVKNGTPWQEDLEIYTHKGNLKWMRTIGQAEIVNGKCVKIYGSFQDIDERKKAELEILKLYEEKKTILESIGDAFFTVNKNWVVGYWNKEAEKMLMVPKSKIVGQYLWDVFSESVGSVSYKKYHESIETNKKVVFEDNYSALNKWFEISAYPSENGLSVYFKDITERKLSEIELHELHQNLQKTANNLAASNAELEQFAYIASHDLQEPLRMITSFLTQLEKKYTDIIDEKGKQYIYFAVDGAKRMRQIILDLLKFSRVGRFEGDLENVDTHKVLEEIISVYKKQIEETGAIIHFDKLPVVKTFRGPFSQVMQNLVSNALKYQKAGQQPIINIGVEELTAHWKFSVQDNGIGIDPSYFDKIFVIFQRLHHKEEYNGTGIGLAIVKKIVEALGGGIWVESAKGKGSTFYFTIER